MSASKKRLDWPDIIKGLGMLVVVFSHFPHPKAANIFYSPFFMAIFFFVSGYFFSPKGSFREFVVNKFWKLLVPLYMFGSLGILESVLLGGEPLTERLVGILVQIGGKADAMWFFACLFTVEILFYWVFKAAERFRSHPVWVLTGLTGLLVAAGIIFCAMELKLPWHIETACVVELFFLGGYLCRKFSLEEKVSLPGCLVAWLGYAALIYFFPNPVDMHLDKFGNIFLFYIQATVGTYAFLCLAVLLTGKGGWLNDFVVWVGQNTIQYFFFQGTLITVTCKVLSLAGITAGSSLVLSLLCTFAIYIALCIPAWIVRRYFPIFLGKR